jgi:7-cyano-7-deazaguanine synthase
MKIVAIYSGGLDSTVLLYHLLDAGHEVRALSIHYGQRHERELEYAALGARRLGIEHRIADLQALRPLLDRSSQTSLDVAVPEGHYAADTMKLTVVPNRNMLLLAVAGAWAVSTKSQAVAYGAHAGDHAQYPDCRVPFVEAMAQALALCDFEPLSLMVPFATWSKAAIVARGNRLQVPFEDTWSCYKGSWRHCGRCGTCVERAEAFSLVGVPDPTEYEDPTYWQQVST